MSQRLLTCTHFAVLEHRRMGSTQRIHSASLLLALAGAVWHRGIPLRKTDMEGANNGMQHSPVSNISVLGDTSFPSRSSCNNGWSRSWRLILSVRLNRSDASPHSLAHALGPQFAGNPPRPSRESHQHSQVNPPNNSSHRIARRGLL